MKSSKEAELSSKDLNNILPSYLIKEVHNIKSDGEEKNSKISEEIRIFNIPIFNNEKESKNEKDVINSPLSFKLFECFIDSPKTDSSNFSPHNDSPISQSNSLDDKNEFQNQNNEQNSNYNNIFNNNIILCSDMNNKKAVYNSVNLTGNNHFLYANKVNYNDCNNLYNNNIKDNNNRNSINNNLYIQNQNYNNSFNLNSTYQQNKNNIIFNFENNKNNNNFQMNNINSNTFPKGNIINNYFNNINNINIIQNNFIENLNILNNLRKNQNAFFYENYMKNQNNNFNNFPFQDKNINDFIKYINSLPMPLVNFLCTPKGTLEIQKKLEKLSKEYKVLLVNILKKQGLYIIMKNTYGNYFFQQLIKNNDKVLISLIISYISENLVDISKDFQGTFSIQALLDEISSYEEEQNILNCIKKYEMEMAFNKNATHVLQKIVLLFPDIHRVFLNEIILDNFIALSLDSNGICLIKIFIKTNTLIGDKKRINEKIVNNFVILSESPFGNYGVQYLMEIWDENDLKDVKNKILENLYELSLQQFSSNVIEKAIEIFTEENRTKILKKLCFENNFVLTLVNNKFGKFVLNKAIKYMQKDLLNKFQNNLNNEINKDILKTKDKNKFKKLLTRIKSCRKKDIYFDDKNKNFYNSNSSFNNDEKDNINNYNKIVYNEDVNLSTD